MAKKKSNSKVRDYRHDEKRKNNPPIGMVSYEPKIDGSQTLIQAQSISHHPEIKVVAHKYWGRRRGLVLKQLK